MVILHGVNVVLSYFIMLVAMTYNVELFSMAVTGLTVGYMFFNLTEPPRHTTDPCCSLGHENENEKRATHNAFRRVASTELSKSESSVPLTVLTGRIVYLVFDP